MQNIRITRNNTEMKAGMNLATPRSRCSINLTELVEEYIDEKLLRPESATTYRKVVKRWIEENQASTICDITREDVKNWCGEILDRARPETWNKYRRHLRALINFAISRGYYDSPNPFSDVAPARASQRLTKTVQEAIVHGALELLLLENCPIKPGWFWVLVMRAFFYTGVRRRQLVGLQWGDVDFQRCTWRLRSETSKTTREWFIPVPLDVIEDLHILYERTQERLSQLPQQTAQVFNVTLFYDRYRGPEMNGDQVAGFFARLSKHLGQPISAHRLRHTMATILAPKGDIRALQDMLGHTSISTTMRYIHPDVENMRVLQSRLPRLPSLASIARPGKENLVATNTISMVHTFLTATDGSS
ncbi:MAG TPA: site-specific integrase [Chromatiales bacterium]|nr:site-specific integrase [Chromatiales bacterium]